jgi:Tol biopolymer transport system component
VPIIGGAKPDPRADSSAPGERLDSWKEIASHLRRSVRTVTRWEQEQNLPVHRQKTGAVYAYKSELDAWWSSQGHEVEGDPRLEVKTPPLRGVWIVVVAAALILAAVLTALVTRTKFKPEPKLAPLTTYPGIEGPPSLSPDGNQVAFDRDGDIFVKQADGESLLQLTHTAAAEHNPAWSPDGRRIAFTRDGAGIFVISPLGGDEKKVAEAHWSTSKDLWTMAWTMDSQTLIVSELTSSITAALFMVSVETGRKRQITWPTGPGRGDRWPAVSPDGRTLAFARFPQDSGANVFVMPLGGGAPYQISDERATIWGLAWTPDGHDVAFSSDRIGGISRLWRTPASSRRSSPSLIEGPGEDARFPSFSRPQGKAPARLAYQRFEQEYDIRRAGVVGEASPHHALKASTPFLASTRTEVQPDLSPDGKKIAFVSNRSGANEIWLCDSDGSNPVRRTSLGSQSINPRWSPDSVRIAFFANTGVSGKYQNYVMNAAGGSPWRLSQNENQPDFRPSWSRDGRWIYFGSGRSGTVQIWKVPAGGGQSVQLTKGGGGEALESPDGTVVYYTKVPGAGPGLWSIPASGGKEMSVLDSPRFGFWAVARKGIYFIDFNVTQDAPKPVKFFNFEHRRVMQIGTVEMWLGTAGPDSPSARTAAGSSM